MRIISQPSNADRLGEFLKRNLTFDWSELRIAVAFVKRSGTKHIVKEISKFAEVSKVEIIAGIDHQGTSIEGLQDLLDAIRPRGKIIVFHNRLPFTFHPKVYLFKRPGEAEVSIGSGNLTECGLYTNYEMSALHQLDLDKPSDREFLQSIERTLDEWADTSTGISAVLDENLLDELADDGLIVGESDINAGRKHNTETSSSNNSIPQRARPAELVSPFMARPVAPAPKFAISVPVLRTTKHTTEFTQKLSEHMFTLHSPSRKPMHFVMTLQKTDVGVGQTTEGASRRSPEIFVPLAARDAAPEFWGWPQSFREDHDRKGKFDRSAVRVRLGTDILKVNMMTWPVKHDFRLRAEALRSAGNVGDILHLERVEDNSEFDYYAEVIPPDTSQYGDYQAICTHSVRNSKKSFGYF